MLSFNSLLLASDAPKELAAFYGKVFEKKPEWGEGDWAGFQVGSGFLTIGPHDKVQDKAKEPERIIFNFETKDVKQEFERIKALGATVVAEPYNPMQEKGMLIATFSDPDGNYFQLMSPMDI